MDDNRPKQEQLGGLIPAPMSDAVNRAANAAGQTRAAFLREVVADALKERGLWPPASGSKAA
jgi:cytolysin (calcineurin-like family phosphatase)